MDVARFTTLADKIDWLNGAAGRTASWCAVAIVLIGFVVVLLRYVLGLGSIWLQESILYFHAALFLLAAAWTLREGAHVRIDVFYADASPRVKAWVDLLGTLFLLLPFAFAILWFSLPYVTRSWEILERSREASGLPLVFLLKTLIPVFAVLLALQGLSQIVKALAFLFPLPGRRGEGAEPRSDEAGEGHP
jgi:TRAP-type mannitol/chloroaromatic compound transport system permease small subunit